MLADGTVKTYRYHRNRRSRSRGDTLGELIAAWERAPEWRGLATATKNLHTLYVRPLAMMGEVEAARVQRRDLLNIRNAIAVERGDGAANAFIKTASTLFAWAVESGWLTHSPVVRVKRLKGGHLPAWSEGDVALALPRLSEPLRRAVVLALYTGQRRGDLIRLPWSAYDGQVIRLRQEKTGAILVVPCHPLLKAELDAWRQSSVVGIGNAPILVNAKGKPWVPNNLTTQLGMALDAIEGFPAGRNIHGLRKLAATNLAHAGCSLHEIAAITGHKTLAMLQLYTASVDQERLAGAAIHRLSERKVP